MLKVLCYTLVFKDPLVVILSEYLNSVYFPELSPAERISTICFLSGIMPDPDILRRHNTVVRCLHITRVIDAVK